MALIACPSCRGRTPSTSVSCVQCGTLPPACGDCSGAGSCPACADPTADPFAGMVCDRCGGTGQCVTCAGRKRHWPAAVAGE